MVKSFWVNKKETIQVNDTNDSDDDNNTGNYNNGH